jgi:hypothetical protein
MFSGPPLPLAPEFRLKELMALGVNSTVLGVWMRGGRHVLRCRLAGLNFGFLVSGNLGLLLGTCQQIVIREGSHARVLGAERLIQWRALQVVTGTPYLPNPDCLSQWFPGAVFHHGSFQVPLHCRGPEEVLADCLVHGIPVAESRIIYRQPVPL